MRNKEKIKNRKKKRTTKEGELEQKLFVSYSPRYKNYMRQLRKEQLDRAAGIVATPFKAKKNQPNDPKRFIQEERFTGDGEGFLPLFTRTDLTNLLYKAFGFRTNTQVVSLEAVKKHAKNKQKVNRITGFLKPSKTSGSIFSRDPGISICLKCQSLD